MTIPASPMVVLFVVLLVLLALACLVVRPRRWGEATAFAISAIVFAPGFGMPIPVRIGLCVVALLVPSYRSLNRLRNRKQGEHA